MFADDHRSEVSAVRGPAWESPRARATTRRICMHFHEFSMNFLSSVLVCRALKFVRPVVWSCVWSVCIVTESRMNPNTNRLQLFSSEPPRGLHCKFRQQTGGTVDEHQGYFPRSERAESSDAIYACRIRFFKPA